MSNHSRAGSGSSNAHRIAPKISFSKPTSVLSLSPIHPGPPTISARTLLNPVSQHVLPTRPVTAQMGLGSKSKLPARQPLLGSLPSSASCSLITRKARIAFSQPHPRPLITFQISVSRQSASPTHLRHWPPSCPALRRTCSWHLSLSALTLPAGSK